MTAGNTSFGSLRSRKVDFKRSLQVLRWTECPDLDESSSLNRAIPTVATGVEKEEEEEHHLQVALNASQSGLSTSSIVIPTPDASRVFEGSERFYTANFIQPKTLIRFSAQVEDCISCPYCMDEIDEEWLNSYSNQCKEGNNEARSSPVPCDPLNADAFESIMYTLECLSNDREFIGGEPITLSEATLFIFDHCPTIKITEACISDIFDHWKKRRYASGQPKPVMPVIKTDELGFRSDSDPYVCFRRREIKPLRKARRGDLASLEKLRRLRDEMCRARAILDLVLQRETLRKESLLLEKAVFDQRILVRKLKKKFGVTSTEKDIEASPDSRKKKRKLNDEQRTKIKIPVQKLKEAAAFMSDATDSRDKIASLENEIGSFEALAKRRKLSDEKSGWIDNTENPFSLLEIAKSNWEAEPDSRFRSLCTPDTQQALRSSITAFPSRVLQIRTRIGRGGRICFDRHIKQSDRHHLLGGYQSSFYRNRDALDSNEYYDSLGYNSESDVEDFIEEIEDDLKNVTYRAFHLAPNQEDIYSLMTKPVFSEQINPKPTLDSQRFSYPAPHVSRPPTTPTAPATTIASAPPTQPQKKGNPVVQKMLVESREEAKKVQLHLMQGTRTSGLGNQLGQSNQGSPPSDAGANGTIAQIASMQQQTATNPTGQNVANGTASIGTNPSVSSPKLSSFPTLPVNGQHNPAAGVNSAFPLNLNSNLMGLMPTSNNAPVRFPQQFRFPHQMNQSIPMNNPAALHLLYQQQQAMQRRFANTQAAGMTSTPHLRPHQSPGAAGASVVNQAHVLQQLMKKGGQPGQHIAMDHGMLLNHLGAVPNQTSSDATPSFQDNENM
ncbi:Enhancer of polycomb-like protein 1 [Dinochytrium kinnereticum]|nr:Enhancer of polycomb-like protein 1 [Dinochytrium kinnereticum]